jgi:hypothetical protein
MRRAAKQWPTSSPDESQKLGTSRAVLLPVQADAAGRPSSSQALEKFDGGLLLPAQRVPARAGLLDDVLSVGAAAACSAYAERQV